MRQLLARMAANIAGAVWSPVVAVTLALSLGAVLIALVGADPVVAYSSLFSGAFGNLRSITEVLVKTAPLLLAGLGISVAFHSGVISVGAEGQLLIGGLAMSVIGVTLAGLPALVVIPLSIVGAFAAGALWGFIPGWLYAKKGLSTVINTIMLNYVAYYLVEYCINGPFRDPKAWEPQSPMLARHLWWPTLPGTRLHLGFLVALAAAALMYLLLYKLPLGFRIRTIGANPTAARYAGMNVERTVIIALAVSGGLAGLAGAGEIGGIHQRVMGGFSSGYGWDAIAVALLGRLSPLGIVVSSIFWAALRVGANSMQRAAQIPATLVFTIQALSIFFILASDLFIVAKDKLFRRARLSRAEEGA